MADLCGWKIRFKVILIDWESFDDILMHFNDQIREKTWWVNARKMLIRKDSTENQSVCMPLEENPYIVPHLKALISC